MRRDTTAADVLAIAQGGFYVATGLWPIVHLPSFEAVTGEKTDKWLVKTVGALIAAAGATMTTAGLRKRVTPEIALLAAGSAAALAVVDVNYTAKRVIAPVYLLDAAAEAALIALWAGVGSRSPRFDESEAGAR
jgi:hypothetical protein